MFAELMLAAMGWATLSILAAQAAGIVLMWWLGLPPKKLVHEIEDVQNTAVGAAFFVVAVAASIYIGVFFSAGYSEQLDFLPSAGWFTAGLLVSFVYVYVIFLIAHRIMDRKEDENIYRYLRREIIEEQNAALAFFLGGLSVSPFVAMVFQII
jgi:hypothetical protein